MKGRCIYYSEAELDYIKSNCTLPRSELHTEFNSKFGRDVSRQNLEALCKRRGWMTGRTGCFKKGNIPHPDAHPKGPNKTSFKKGETPKNHKPIGSERVDSKDGFVIVKVAEPSKWKHKHRHVWEQINGPVPRDRIVTFIDGNNRNFDPCNLALISRAENLALNRLKYKQQPEYIKPTVKLIAQIQVKSQTLTNGKARAEAWPGE